MTEAEWLTCTEPSDMLAHLQSVGPLGSRKLRLFAIACARRVEHLLTEEDEIGRQALETAEDMAEGKVDPATIARLQEQTQAQATRIGAVENLEDYTSADCARHNAVDAAYNVLQEDCGRHYIRPSRLGCARMGGDYINEPADLMEVVKFAIYAAHQAAGDQGDWYTSEAMKTERGHQATLLRDIFGNPFRPVAVDPRWLTSTVVSLAQSVYADRAFDRLPILADALEDAGCDNADVLTHCRGDGPHVRGCWVVDLILGKE